MHLATRKTHIVNEWQWRSAPYAIMQMNKYRIDLFLVYCLMFVCKHIELPLELHRITCILSTNFSS